MSKVLDPAETDGEAPVKRQRAPIVRRAVLDAAATLFAERGYGGTNLRDVADALGMSRPGLYYHFPNKEKLLEALIEEVTLSSERQFREMAAQTERPPEEALRYLVIATTHWVLAHRTLFRVVDRSEAEMPPELRRSHEASKRAILDHVTSIIDRGVSAGVFRPIDTHIAALSILGMRNWTAWWYNPAGRFTAEQVAESIADLAVRSVLRSDGHRSRSDRLQDGLRILREDVDHLTRLIETAPQTE